MRFKLSFDMDTEAFRKAPEQYIDNMLNGVGHRVAKVYTSLGLHRGRITRVHGSPIISWEIHEERAPSFGKAKRSWIKLNFGVDGAVFGKKPENRWVAGMRRVIARVRYWDWRYGGGADEV